MRLLQYIYIFSVLAISTYAAEINKKTFDRNSSELKKKLIGAKKLFKSQVPESSKPETDISDSIFIINDKTTSGSGFYTSLWGVPVGITSARLIATMRTPAITDSKGNSYKIKSMLTLPEDDIAVFELDNPGILKALPAVFDTASFPVSSPVSAYGNNQAKGIVTKLDGTIQNLENNKIGISTKLIPESGGGALLCSNKVIGMLDYPEFCVPDMANLQGSIFEGKNRYLKKYYGSPGCFGIRLAAIDPAKSEIFNPVSADRDIKAVQELREANNKALDHKIKVMKIILKGKSSAKLIKSAWALVHRNQYLKKAIENFYSGLSFDPEKHICSNQTLKKQFLEELLIYHRNACMWDFEELFASRNPAFLKKFIPVVKSLKRHFQIAPKCPACKGKGYRIVEIDNPEYKTDKMKFAFNTTYVKCEQCHGTGKVNVSKYYYVLQDKQASDRMFKPLKIDFLGFTPGSERTACYSEARKMIFAGRLVSDLSRTCFYGKNHRFKLNNSVVLNYVLGRLQDIRIYFPYAKELYQNMKERLEKKYGKITWETEDKATFCEIDKPDYRITIGWVFRISPEFKLKPSLYVSCTHKGLSKAKCAFPRLTDKHGKIIIPSQKAAKARDTGF